MNPINRPAWSRLAAISVPFFRSEVRWRAWGALGLILFLLLSLNGLNVINSYVGRRFMTALAERQAHQFALYGGYYLAVFAGSTIVAVLYQFTQDRLALLWRQWLSNHLIRGYLSEHAYYEIEVGHHLDNPDQRITEDVRSFTTSMLSFLLILLNSLLTILAFAGILWLITPALLFTAILYAACGSLATVYLGRRLPGLNNQQLKKEADLRHSLIRVREYSEPIALMQGEAGERSYVARGLQIAVDNFAGIIRVNRNVGFFTSGYNYLVPILPLLLVAPRYFRGDVEFGAVTQGAMAFAQVIGALSVVIAQFQNLSMFAAVVTRLGEIQETIQGAIERPRPIEIIEDDSRFAFERLSLWSPEGGGRPLVSELSLEIEPGQRLLINGPNGAGKTAVFKATAGLWRHGRGRIVRPPRTQMMFLPERPYTIPGTLRDQLLYGLAPADYADRDLAEKMESVGLGYVLERGGLDSRSDWVNELSEGEQQLLAIARLLLAAPPFALLDYATSALLPDKARQVYEILARSAITYISIGDPQLLDRYHDLRVDFETGGGWRLVSPLRRAAG